MFLVWLIASVLWLALVAAFQCTGALAPAKYDCCESATHKFFSFPAESTGEPKARFRIEKGQRGTLLYLPRISREGAAMYLSGQSLIVILLVGLIAGWLAGEIVAGGGFGLIGDIAIGIVGAFIGSWLLPQLGIHIGGGLVNMIIVATIGAIVLLILLSLLRGGGWGWGYRRRYW